MIDNRSAPPGPVVPVLVYRDIAGSGRGTSVLRFDGTRWTLLAAHLGPDA